MRQQRFFQRQHPDLRGEFLIASFSAFLYTYIIDDLLTSLLDTTVSIYFDWQETECRIPSIFLHSLLVQVVYKMNSYSIFLEGGEQ
jgi:hypothetical protein